MTHKNLRGTFTNPAAKVIHQIPQHVVPVPAKALSVRDLSSTGLVLYRPVLRLDTRARLLLNRNSTIIDTTVNTVEHTERKYQSGTFISREKRPIPRTSSRVTTLTKIKRTSATSTLNVISITKIIPRNNRSQTPPTLLAVPWPCPCHPGLMSAPLVSRISRMNVTSSLRGTTTINIIRVARNQIPRPLREGMWQFHRNLASIILILLIIQRLCRICQHIK